MLRLPTAPFVEAAVIAHVRAACGRLSGVTSRTDRWGNVVARYRRLPRTGVAPLVFTAHMDHPGFAALEMSATKGQLRLRGAFRGWVEPEYFLGTGVRFWDGGGWVRGKIARITKTAKLYRMIGRTARPEEVEVVVEKFVPPDAPGMWDLPDPY